MQNKIIMRKIFLLVNLLSIITVLNAQKYWQDPNVNEINRAPMHSSFFAYESGDAAEMGEMVQSTNFLSLNGSWNFNWVEHAWERPTDFYKVDYNDKDWGNMPVPGVWELNGYGDPQYVNIGYSWRSQYKHNPPIVPAEENNHVGTYRKEITLPKSWSGKDIVCSLWICNF